MTGVPEDRLSELLPGAPPDRLCRHRRTDGLILSFGTRQTRGYVFPVLSPVLVPREAQMNGTSGLLILSDLWDRKKADSSFILLLFWLLKYSLQLV